MKPTAIGCLLAVVLGACTVGEEGFPTQPTPTPGDDGEVTPPPELTKGGVVTEPEFGATLVGDPATIAFRVAGEHTTQDQSVDVQVLADPNDLASWTTIATTTATTKVGDNYRFAVDVKPVTSTATAVRWPYGGVLRLRVIETPAEDATEDAVALPFDLARPEDSVLAVVNPTLNAPTTWMYLREQDPGSIAETQAYYAATNAPATLTAFMTRYGFPGDETAAAYYNAGDLGIGREMHCRATQNPANGVACYVRNFGTFGGKREEAITQLVAAGTPLATVTMVYTPPITTPNAVTFQVYGPDGALANQAQLDSHGDNISIPQNCLNCHGGRATYDAATHAAKDAQFLAFDPAQFAYANVTNLTFVAQETKFKQLNALVAKTSPPIATKELIDGLFPANAAYDPTFVPTGWAESDADRVIYKDVIAPYCRGCHASFSSANDPLAFVTADQFKSQAAILQTRACGVGPKGMPVAEQTILGFYNSKARALMLPWLGIAGACAPNGLVAP